MKKGFFSIFLILSVLATLQLSAGAKSKDFNKAKRNAEAAFAELEGKIPAPAASSQAESPDQSLKSKGKTAEKPSQVSDDDMLQFAVLKGEGFGKDEKTARAAAISELSNSIVVIVSAQFVSVHEKKNGEYFSALKNDVKTKSDTFLKGVRFTKPRNTEYGLSVIAFMTEKDVVNTINYLIKTIPFDIETLSPDKFDDVMTSLSFAYSLLYAVSGSQVKEREKYIKILDSLKAETEKLATSGSVYFSAKSGVEGKVGIAGAEYALNRKIHLKPGEYSFSVKSSGYKTQSGKVTLLKGDRKFVELIFVPENLGKREVFLRVDSPVRMIDDIEKVLLDFGIVPTQNKNLPHQLIVVSKGTSTKVGNYERYLVEVDVHTFKNGQKFKITHYEHKPFFVTPQNKNEKIREESSKVSVAVVRKFLSSIDLGEFFGSAE